MLKEKLGQNASVTRGLLATSSFLKILMECLINNFHLNTVLIRNEQNLVFLGPSAKGYSCDMR